MAFEAGAALVGEELFGAEVGAELLGSEFLGAEFGGEFLGGELAGGELAGGALGADATIGEVGAGQWVSGEWVPNAVESAGGAVATGLGETAALGEGVALEAPAAALGEGAAAAGAIDLPAIVPEAIDISPELTNLVASGQGGDVVAAGGGGAGQSLGSVGEVSTGLPSSPVATAEASGAGAPADAVSQGLTQGSAVEAPVGGTPGELTPAELNAPSAQLPSAQLPVPGNVPVEPPPLPGADPSIPPGTPTALQKGLKALGITGIDGDLNLGTVAGIAGLGLNAANQKKATAGVGNAQQQIAQAVAPLSATQQNLLSSFNSGQLTAADSQAIQDWVATSKAQLRQQYGKAGIADSDMARNAEAAIDQKAAAMKDQALKNYLQSALQTTGAITGPYAGIAQQQLSQDQQLQAAASKLFSAVGQQQAGQPVQPIATP